MTHPIKDHLAHNLHQAKATSSNRLARIRDILKQAIAQSYSEVKEGTGEVRALVADSYAIAQEELAATTTDAQPSEQTQPKSLFVLIVQRLRQQVSGQVQQQAVQVKERLHERYGDRFASVQQPLQRLATWYHTTKAKAQQQGIDPLQHQQAQAETKAAAAGASMAQMEQQVRQQAKAWMQSVTAKS